MATMTISEAKSIENIVCTALQDKSHRYFSVSALKGYDIYQICTALKLNIANEFLLLAERDDFEDQFAEGVNSRGTITSVITIMFVPDNKVDSPKHAFELIDDSTMAFRDAQFFAQTVYSFGDYCQNIGAQDPIYWQKIYTQLGLEYTSSSPKGNDPDIGNKIMDKSRDQSGSDIFWQLTADQRQQIYEEEELRIEQTAIVFSKKTKIWIAVYFLGCVLIYFGVPESFMDFYRTRQWTYELETDIFRSLGNAVGELIRPFAAVLVFAWTVFIPVGIVAGLFVMGFELLQFLRKLTNRDEE